MNVTRQPLIVAFPTLLLVLGALLLRKQGLSFAPEAVGAVQSLPGLWIGDFQQLFPRISWALWYLFHLAAAVTLGRMGLRHKLYASNTLLAVPLYGVVACGIFVADDFLAGALGALLLARAMRNFCASYRNGYAFSSLFRGALYLGLLVVIYPAALPLLLLAPLVMILFKRTLREWIVLICGLLLPLASLCYLYWAVTGAYLPPLEQMAMMVTSSERLSLFDEASVLLIAQLVVLLATSLCALFYYLSDIYAATSKARAILSAHVWLFLLCGAGLMMPSATTNSLTLLAVAVVMLLPFLFVRIRPLVANILYGTFLLLFVLRLFF